MSPWPNTDTLNNTIEYTSTYKGLNYKLAKQRINDIITTLYIALFHTFRKS